MADDNVCVISPPFRLVWRGPARNTSAEEAARLTLVIRRSPPAYLYPVAATAHFQSRSVEVLRRNCRRASRGKGGTRASAADETRKQSRPEKSHLSTSFILEATIDQWLTIDGSREPTNPVGLTTWKGKRRSGLIVLEVASSPSGPHFHSRCGLGSTDLQTLRRVPAARVDRDRSLSNLAEGERVRCPDSDDTWENNWTEKREEGEGEEAPHVGG